MIDSLTARERKTAWFIRLVLGLSILLWPLNVVGQAFNAMPISGGPVLTPFNTVAANAPVRVCLLTAFGAPCSTAGVHLYSDYNLTKPINDPAATNSQGIFNVFTTAGWYMVQVSVTPTVTYTYYYSSGSGTSSGGGYPSCTTPSSSTTGIVCLSNVSGDYGAAINSAFAAYNVVEIIAGTPTATTTVTIPNAATGAGGIAGTLRVRGNGTFTIPQILFQDSTTASVPSGLLECPDGATIKLANGSNKTLISDTNFSSLTGGSSLYGAFQARANGCILDGNSANNSSGWVVQLYGRALRLQNGKSFNGAQGGVWIELDHPGDVFNTKLDDFESKIEDWQSAFNTGPGLNIHSGDAFLLFVDTYFNSTWGLISSYNGVHVHGINSYGNTSGGCWATTTGTFIGNDAECDTYTGGVGILNDSTAGPMYLSNSLIGGPGIGIEVEQPGNVFNGLIQGTTTSALTFNGGSINFVGSICPTSGYWLDYSLGANGNSSIITSESCATGTLFHGSPPIGDTLFFPAASQGPYVQFGGTGVLHIGGNAITFPNDSTTLPAVDLQNRWTVPQLFTPSTSTGVQLTDAYTAKYCVYNDYCGFYETGAYQNDIYYGKDATTDDFVVQGNAINPSNPTTLFRFGTSAFSTVGLGGFGATTLTLTGSGCGSGKVALADGTGCVGIPSGTFTALSGDAVSGATGGATEVVGLLDNPLPSLTAGYLQWTGSAFAWSTSSGTTLQTNGVNNTSQTALNFITSTVNAAGLTATPSNPSTSNEKFEITGSYSGSITSGQVTSGLGYTPANCTAGTTGSDCLTLTSGLVLAANLPVATGSTFGTMEGVTTTAGLVGVGTTTSGKLNFIDYLSPYTFASANCVSGSPASAWNTVLTAQCRAGTYNLGGNLPFSDASTAQFQLFIPSDWDSASSLNAVRLHFTTGANTSGTIIFQVQIGCYAETNAYNDDPPFQTAQVFSTITAATANFANSVSVALNSTSLTNCAAPGGMLVKITRNTDSASSPVPVTGATVTLARKLSTGAL